MASAYEMALERLATIGERAGEYHELEQVDARAWALATLAVVDELKVISARLESIESRIPYAPFPK